MDVDETPRVVGRARDADLALTDLSVSRRHLGVQLVEGQLLVRALPETAAFLRDRVALREAVLSPGAAITVGGTVISVVPQAVDGEETPLPSIERTEVRTLLQGAAIDVKGLAAIFALTSALDHAGDRAAVGDIVSTWSRNHADAEDATLHAEGVSSDIEPCAEHALTPDDLIVRDLADGKATVTVPAHAGRRSWITYRFDRPKATIGEAQRRMLLVAGRVCASSLARIDAFGALEAKLRDAQAVAIGSARSFLGSSPAAQKVAATVPRLADADAPVLLHGETGTGKSFVARLIHESGSRAGEPLRVLNCAAIPETLLESELFGHERGAFTGANSAREGALESAGRGTLFLDEVGELSLGSQAKLLRALDEKKFERVGSNRTLELTARVICATNRDLVAMSDEGRFRKDLYYRISVVSLHIPPLRERGADLELLAKQILADMAPRARRRIDGFSPAALDAIRRYAWPGNVRELRNAIDHAVLLGSEAQIEPADFPEPLGFLAQTTLPDATVVAEDPDTQLVARLPARLDELEALAIRVALRATGGNRTKAAALLGIGRATLHRKMEPVNE